MTAEDLERQYRSYISCLNRREWLRSSDYVAADVVHNGRQLGLSGYREMLEQDVAAIPDLQFTIETLVAAPTQVAARLLFDCRPSGMFLGLPVNGQRVRFAEHVFYRYAGDYIAEVWSLIDRSAIQTQLAMP